MRNIEAERLIEIYSNDLRDQIGLALSTDECYRFVRNIVNDGLVLPETVDDVHAEHKQLDQVTEIDKITELLDMNIPQIKAAYHGWDKGDCSLVGIAELYLCQCMLKHRNENGEYYDRSIDDIKLRI